MTNIIHKRFGKGTIKSFNKKSFTIDFNGQEKILMKSWVLEECINEDGTPFKGIKVTKKTQSKTDWSKYTDEDLLNIYEEEKGKFIGAINDSNKEAKEEGRKGFGSIN